MFHAISYFLKISSTHKHIAGISAHLEPIAYTEDWHTKFKHLGINVGCILVVDGVRGTGKNDT